MSHKDHLQLKKILKANNYSINCLKNLIVLLMKIYKRRTKIYKTKIKYFLKSLVLIFNKTKILLQKNLV